MDRAERMLNLRLYYVFGDEHDDDKEEYLKENSNIVCYEENLLSLLCGCCEQEPGVALFSYILKCALVEATIFHTC